MHTLTTDKIKELVELVSAEIERENYHLAKTFQSEIVQLYDGDPTCTTQDLGDSFHLLGDLTFRSGETDEAVTILIKALGFRRLYYGKGHAKVAETMTLIKDIRREFPTIPSIEGAGNRTDRNFKAPK